MSANLHFHEADTETLFHIIGSADRDVLLDAGVTLGSEFLAPDDEEPAEEFFADKEDEEPGDWDYEEDKANAARETLVKMVMSGLPTDLAEDEAFVVQDYFAAFARRSDQVHAVEAEDLCEEIAEQHGDETAAAVRQYLTAGLPKDALADCVAYLQESGASPELAVRLQMLLLGRLPEADEPTFTDLEEGEYSARFGYLHSAEAAQVADEMSELAEGAVEELAPVCHLMAALLHSCASHGRDLLVTIDE